MKHIVRIKIIPALLLLSLAIGFSCKKEDKGTEDIAKKSLYDTTKYVLNSRHFPTPDISADNQLTIQKVKLGRMLFYEKMLSKDGSMACASCHRQKHAFTDTSRFSVGVEGLEGKRQAMAIFNMAWNTNEFFWDGRSHLLRDQSLMPIQDPLEMNETLENVTIKLNGSEIYLEQFEKAFGNREVTSEKISLALEQFMLTIVSNQSKYDRYLNGEVELSESEERGRKLFVTEYNPFFPDESGADCVHCHTGFNFENDRYFNNGLDEDADFQDIGREKVTNDPADRAKFKITSLRNIELTAPYMHDGRFATLEEVIEHYNSGIKNSSTVDPAIKNTMQTGLMLTTQDKQDLIAFLKTLTDYELISKPEYSDPFE